ncbi:unnamed protein product [Brassica napus]|uniref:Uncharacterized protein n=2 Tax=Brassica TaxID=3705 RepID=M4DHU3_BRACM|nr:unnamed protein product [Brassica napus]
MSSFPLVSFLITLLLAAAVCTHGQEWVRDTNGNRVRINDQYFIQPVNTENNGGGLVPLAAKISLCLLGITQALTGEPGVRVSFSFPPSLIPPIPFSPVSTKFGITIEFKSNVCKDISKFWEVDGSSLISEEPAIQIGGNPRERNSRFKIEKVGEEGRTNIYRFTTSDGTVGAVPGPLDSSQLVLTNDVAKTIFFKLIKVNAVTTDVTSTSRVDKLGLRMIFITIEFKSNDCKELSKFWEVYEARNIIEPPILIGGRPEEPNSRFKIEKVGEDGTNIYKLTTSTGNVGSIPLLGTTPQQVLVLTNDVAKTIFLILFEVK